MDNKARLAQWMKDNGHTNASLAAATGDTYSSISMLANGKRDINDAFKWRFANAFGMRTAKEIFGEQPEQASEVTPVSVHASSITN